MAEETPPTAEPAAPPVRAAPRRREAGGRRWAGRIAVITVLLAWQGSVTEGLLPADLLPGPIAVAGAFWHTLWHGYRDTSLAFDVFTTVARCLAGFLLALLLGVPLGLWMGVNRVAAALFNYLVQFLRPLPPLSYMILLILWFGTGNLSKVLLLFLTAFPIVVSAATAGVRSVPRLRLQAAAMLGAKRWQIFLHVVMPSAAPMIFTGLKIALAAAFSTVVAAEFVTAHSGLGWMVLSASKYLQNATVLMGVVLLGLIGMALSMALNILDARLIHWRRVG